MPFCTTCDEYAYGPGHQCPPTWNVWPEGQEEELNPKHAWVLFADDAEAAALKFADEHSDDGPWTDNLFVRMVGMEGTAQEFALNHSYQIVYETAKPRRPINQTS